MAFSPEQDIATSQAYADKLKAEGRFLDPTKPVTPTPDVPSVSSDFNMTGGSDRIRQQEQVVKTRSEELMAQLEESQNTSKETRGKQSADLERLLAATKEITETDLTAIAQAGEEAGKEYDPLIADAVENRRQTQAKANVGAGEAGGFMNTQYAGQAALTPVEGGNFVGAGGKLAQIKGQLDQNVFKIQQAKIQAVDAARAAASKAIRTGKIEDLKLAEEIYDRANKASEAEQAGIAKLADIDSQIQRDRQAQVKFTAEQQDTAYKRIKELGSFGFDASSFSDEDKTQMEQQAGLPPGTLDAIIDTSFDLQNAENEKDQLDVTSKIFGILNDIPAGRQIKIGDSVYEGIKESNPYTQTFKEEDASGNVTFVTIDQRTGEIVSSASGGRIGTGRKATDGERSESSFAAALDELKAGTGQSGFVNPGVYSEVLDRFRKKGQAAKFMTNFPPEDYLDSTDPKALKFFQTATQAQPEDDEGDLYP